MGKGIVYVAAAVVFTGLGALVAGLAVWFTVPEVAQKFTSESRRAQCVLESTANVNGTIVFLQSSERAPVDITGDVTGLSPGKHGFHIHAFGVSGADCKAAQGHYNPFGSNHSAPNATERHVGDLGNIVAGEDFVANVKSRSQMAELLDSMQRVDSDDSDIESNEIGSGETSRKANDSDSDSDTGMPHALNSVKP
ncbi:superoxide dismutase [Cu-Zn]-like [Penaeus japonicus]|uniref:superoxide dismutase [Cu-Zn]-like n=1 Tax=Penaeus japonicus TaxID=27405 RepID=UPI001C713333|nr:superoxide dismutase [Cu-Zn]-like [Penaeus japonicus]